MFHLKLNISINVWELLIFRVVASLLDDVNMSISSIYLVKNIPDGQMDSARRSSWSIFEMARMPDIFDPIGSPVICLEVFPL